MQKVMICGVDCKPGDAHCNNYCNHNKSKPMASSPPDATPEQQIETARKAAHAKLDEAERAWYEYYGMLEVGDLRTRAAEIYQNVRLARRF